MTADVLNAPVPVVVWCAPTGFVNCERSTPTSNSIKVHCLRSAPHTFRHQLRLIKLQEKILQNNFISFWGLKLYLCFDLLKWPWPVSVKRKSFEEWFCPCDRHILWRASPPEAITGKLGEGAYIEETLMAGAQTSIIILSAGKINCNWYFEEAVYQFQNNLCVICLGWNRMKS